MPRRTGGKASEEIRRSREACWKYMIRNDHFRRDMRELRAVYRQNDEQVQAKYNELVNKWNLKEIPKAILDEACISDDIPKKNEFYSMFATRPPIGHPVELYEDPSADQPSRTLHFMIDPSYPMDLLLHHFEEELRSKRPVVQSRRRLDKVDFQLAVYDLYEAGRDFEAIARQLQCRTTSIKGRRNTVRSAYVAAKRKIYELDGTKPDADSESHNYEDCPTCRKATNVEQFCRKGKRQLLP